MRTIALLVGLVGCERSGVDEDRIAHEGTVQAPAVSLRRPPPPPPPPLPQVLPPPAEIATFLRAHANTSEPWQVTLYELPDGDPKPPLFMGAHVGRRRLLGRGVSVQLIAKLVQPIYTDGDCGCWVDTSLGIRITRGTASLDLVYNAGHLFLTPEWHSGRFVIVTDTLWLETLREREGL